MNKEHKNHPAPEKRKDQALTHQELDGVSAGAVGSVPFVGGVLSITNPNGADPDLQVKGKLNNP